MKTRRLAPSMLLAALFPLLGCTPATPEENFWKWFRNNEASLFDFEKDQARTFDRLATEIHKVDSRLVFEFGPKENGRREFIISADGIREAFPKVEALFAAAPELPRWKFIKFRPRREPCDISYDGMHVKVDSILVDLKPNGQKVDATIFMVDYTEAERMTYGSIAFLFLDQALGEYDVEMHVGLIEIKPISQAPPHALSIRALPKAFDGLLAR